MILTKNQILDIISDNPDEIVATRAFEIGEEWFNKEDYKFICEFCKFENLVDKAFEKGKNNFDKTDLEIIYSNLIKMDATKSKVEKALQIIFNPETATLDDLKDYNNINMEIHKE